MQHVVFWSAPSGPAFQRVPALADAVDLVQRLRNDHDVTDAEVHELTAVPLNFRTVVVVEAATAGVAAAPTPVASTFAAFGQPLDEPGGELAPLGGSVPAVVPDPVGPFRSLSAVGSASAAEERDDAVATPHLVGLPAVAPDVVEDAPVPAADPQEFRPLEIVAGAMAVAEPAEPVSEPASEAAVRSLGLFA